MGASATAAELHLDPGSADQEGTRIFQREGLGHRDLSALQAGLVLTRLALSGPSDRKQQRDCSVRCIEVDRRVAERTQRQQEPQPDTTCKAFDRSQGDWP